MAGLKVRSPQARSSPAARAQMRREFALHGVEHLSRGFGLGVDPRPKGSVSIGRIGTAGERQVSDALRSKAAIPVSAHLRSIGIAPAHPPPPAPKRTFPFGRKPRAKESPALSADEARLVRNNRSVS
jgi:hypothetical protein